MRLDCAADSAVSSRDASLLTDAAVFGTRTLQNRWWFMVATREQCQTGTENHDKHSLPLAYCFRATEVWIHFPLVFRSLVQP
jgi:hypothetical protein